MQNYYQGVLNRGAFEPTFFTTFLFYAIDYKRSNKSLISKTREITSIAITKNVKNKGKQAP